MTKSELKARLIGLVLMVLAVWFLYSELTTPNRWMLSQVRRSAGTTVRQ